MARTRILVCGAHVAPIAVVAGGQRENLHGRAWKGNPTGGSAAGSSGAAGVTGNTFGAAGMCTSTPARRSTSAGNTCPRARPGPGARRGRARTSRVRRRRVGARAARSPAPSGPADDRQRVFDLPRTRCLFNITVFVPNAELVSTLKDGPTCDPCDPTTGTSLLSGKPVVFTKTDTAEQVLALGARTGRRPRGREHPARHPGRQVAAPDRAAHGRGVQAQTPSRTCRSCTCRAA